MSKYSLVGINGNAFSVMAYVGSCMKKEGKNNDDVEKYQSEAMSGAYENLLVVSDLMIDKLNDESTNA